MIPSSTVDEIDVCSFICDFSTSAWHGHSKWTQWNTSLAVLCVPHIRINTIIRGENVKICHELFEKE